MVAPLVREGLTMAKTVDLDRRHGVRKAKTSPGLVPAGMTRSPGGTSMTATKQLDLFVAFVGDVPLRDDKESMSVPLVSLSKGKRTAPIEWTSADGSRYVRVTANATYGMATIWDMDVLIWVVSQINAAIEAGKPVSPELHFQPYDMLKAIDRGVSGKQYKELEATLNRLAGTLVETNIRTEGNRRKSTFHLLERWDHDTDDITERSKGLKLTLPQWVY